jgi:hypothetical protein
VPPYNSKQILYSLRPELYGPPTAQPIKLKFCKKTLPKTCLLHRWSNFKIQGMRGSWYGAPAGRTWARAPELGSRPRHPATAAPGEEAGPRGAEERSSSPAVRPPPTVSPSSSPTVVAAVRSLEEGGAPLLLGIPVQMGRRGSPDSTRPPARRGHHPHLQDQLTVPVISPGPARHRDQFQDQLICFSLLIF